MRRGDIIVNPWVSRYFNGELNPNYATIYLGDNKSLDYTGKVCGWADKVYKDNPERMTPWKVIGHINLYGIAELAIRDAVFDEENKDEPNSSEKPNNCETCKWGEWYRQGYDITMMDDECGGCCSWNSKWTPKTEQTEREGE